jgi:hypothetical protein
MMYLNLKFRKAFRHKGGGFQEIDASADTELTIPGPIMLLMGLTGSTGFGMTSLASLAVLWCRPFLFSWVREVQPHEQGSTGYFIRQSTILTEVQ